jgi:hypothetical protein
MHHKEHEEHKGKLAKALIDVGVGSFTAFDVQNIVETI